MLRPAQHGKPNRENPIVSYTDNSYGENVYLRMGAIVGLCWIDLAIGALDQSNNDA